MVHQIHVPLPLALQRRRGQCGHPLTGHGCEYAHRVFSAIQAAHFGAADRASLCRWPNDTTAPVIDASYRQFLAAMESHLSNQKFMLGNRPGAGDFALRRSANAAGRVRSHSRAIAHEVSPRTVAQADQIEDQSGLEPTRQDWTDLEEQPESLRESLKLMSMHPHNWPMHGPLSRAKDLGG